MKEHPILFSAPMVRAIHSGQKTQTRRVVRKQFAKDAEPAEVAATTPEGWQTAGHSGLWWDNTGACFDDAIRCPYGQPGDRLWVRETWSVAQLCTPSTPIREKTVYRADFPDDYDGFGIPRWIPSIHMPRKESRITLDVTGVRVERLQDISEADAIAEGTFSYAQELYRDPRVTTADIEALIAKYGEGKASCLYAALWESINGSGSWDENPWVWVVEFKRVSA